MTSPASPLQPPDNDVVLDNVRSALAEDVGSGDITAALIPQAAQARARVITREPGILCGRPWVDTVFGQLDDTVEVEWLCEEGSAIAAGEELFTLQGPARSLLTGERTALNFLQLLSGTATRTRHYVDAVAGTGARIAAIRNCSRSMALM